MELILLDLLLKLNYDKILLVENFRSIKIFFRFSYKSSEFEVLL